MSAFDVLAIGELNLDLILTGMDTMPIPGREVIAKNASLALGSSTAICAAGTARLGLKTALCGVVGGDDFGAKAIQFLKEYGIDTRYVRVDDKLQTGLTVSLSDSRDRALVTHLGSISEVLPEFVNGEMMSGVRHIHVGSYFLQEKLRKGLPRIFAEAASRGVTTSLDSGWDDTDCWDYNLADVLAHTDIFFPNETEALAITGEDSPEGAAAALAKQCRIAVVKCGRDGAWLCGDGRQLHADTYLDMKAVDTTGAGDSFNAGFIYAFLLGYDHLRCMRYGHACASVCVTRIGGASGCATLEEAVTVIERGNL
jgi:sugar/nucleoside kinase (ribokinase family)